MNLSQNYQPVESNAPLRGLSSTLPSTRIDPAFSPNLMNCVVRDGVVTRRAGYRQLGRNLVGRVLAITQFGPLAQNPTLVVLTSHRQYAYNPTFRDFTDVTPGQVTHTITAVGANYAKVAGDQRASFPPGRLVPWIDNTLVNQGVYTVASSTLSAGVTTVNLVETIPNQAAVVGSFNIADDWTTTDRAQIDYVVSTDLQGAQLLATNGSDPPRHWDGVLSHSFADWGPIGIEGFITCRTLAVFGEHLFIGGITATAFEPQLIGWSDAGNFSDFQNGTSGIQLLYMITAIEAMDLLGDRLAIYSYNGIMTGVFVGEPAVFAFELVIPDGTRLTSPHAIVSINVGHIYASEENFYLFDGTRGLRVLGDAIYTMYKVNKDQATLYKCASLNDFGKRTLLYSIPDVNGGSTIYTAEYDPFDLSSIVWAREQYADTPRAFGFFTNFDETLTWADASWESGSTTWGQEVGMWVEEAEQLSFPIRVFGTDTGKVFLVTEGSFSDNGTSSTQTYETADFSIPQSFHSSIGRWDEIEFEGSGSSVEVSVSVDQGRNFTLVHTIALDGSPTPYRLPMDYAGRTLRVRFESTVDFSLRWVRVWVRQGGPR